MDKLFFVYILANCPRGVLYVGVTGDLVGRITVHKAKLAPGFTKTHGVVRLVYFEEHASIIEARPRAGDQALAPGMENGPGGEGQSGLARSRR
jgi:putative endonuclease